MVDLWRLRSVQVTSLCGVLVAALSAPAGAAEVSVAGHGVFYKAKVGEVNTVVVKHEVGSIDSPQAGHETFRITDKTAPLSPSSPCFKNGDEVVCEVAAPGFLSLDLGNKNDTVSQSDVGSDLRGQLKISGGLGDDTLTGSAVADTIDGGPGNDVIDGGDGNDVLTGGAGEDRINGGRDNDTIDGQLGDDKLLDGGAGDDVIHGSAGTDTITGGKGSDKLFGDAGKDTINSRDGETDAIDCGAGKDTVDRDPADTLKHCE